jgi:hypothetical protein
MAVATVLTTGTVLIAGCGGSLLQKPQSAGSRQYLAQLGAAQQRLAAAERRIPGAPRTPAALARSIELLAAAITRLEGDLQRISAPVTATADHKRLIAIVARYRAELALAAREARRRDGLTRAGAELVAATTTASSDFSSAVTKIHSDVSR